MRSIQLLVGVVLLLCPTAKAETIFVGVDDYLENIVEEANDGDVLVLEAGDHVMSGWPGGYQIVISGITLTIRGAVASDGSPASGITNGQTDSIIRCLSGANVLLENLDIHHGEAIGTADRGGALYVSSSSVTMRNCTIRSNRASDYGGGVYCTSSTLLAENCEFRSN